MDNRRMLTAPRARAWTIAAAVAAAVLLVAGGCAKKTPPPEPPPKSDDDAPPKHNAVTPDQMDQIQRTVRAGTPSITRCYTEELDRRGTKKFRGHIVVKIHIGMAGRATKVHFGQNTLKAPRVSECIKKVVMGWELPKLKTATWFSYPFKFEPAY